MADAPARMPLRQRVAAAADILFGGRSGRTSPTPAATPAAAPAGRTVIRMRGRSAYRAAVASRLLGDWLPSLQAPDTEIAGDFRTMRARARELMRSEPVITQYLNLLSSNVLGPEGIQLHTPWPEINDAWAEWIRGPVTADGRLDFNTLQRLQLETSSGEGEAFTRLLTGRDFRHGTALQPIDPDLVDETMNRVGGRMETEVRMGVEVDPFGRRLQYWLWDRPEYGPGSQARGRFTIPADELLHHYRPRRANQTRGITDLASVMLDLNHAGRYVEAAVIGARVGASQMGFIKWTTPELAPASDTSGEEGEVDSNGQVTVVNAGQDLEADPGIVRELEPGQEFQDWSPDYPNDKFADFMRAVGRRCASGLGVEYHALYNDLESVNYSSAREGKLIAWALYRMRQDEWTFSSYDPIYQRWLRNAMLTGVVRMPSPDWRHYPPTWMPRGREWVDPQKDIEAKRTELELFLTSPQRVIRERGLDPVTVLDENQKWREMVRKAGLEMAPAQPQAPGAAPGDGTDGTDNADNAGDNGDTPSENGNGRTQRSLTNRLTSATR